MTEKIGHSKRGGQGYGSSYRKGEGTDLRKGSEIGVVMGGQVWLVKPDKAAEASHGCIWMKSGAVGFKNCTNFYDCTTCKYDFGMRKRVEGGKQISWQDAMRKRSGLDRICRHSLTNRIELRACAYDYECSSCDFDQFFEEIWSPKTESGPKEIREIKGFEIPTGYYFHNGHAWAQIESGGYLRVGMDDFSLKLLGTADSLDLPLIGKELSQNNVGWGIKRDTNQADVRSPVDGVIVEVNSNVRYCPESVNQGPYSEGWLFVVRSPDIKGTVKGLMPDAEGFTWMSNEIETLESMIEEVAGPLAADGGMLGQDIFGNLPQLGWKRLTKTFLGT